MSLNVYRVSLIVTLKVKVMLNDIGSLVTRWPSRLWNGLLGGWWPPMVSEFVPSCECLACLIPHPPSECGEPAVWFIELHLLDHCTLIEGLSTVAGVVCQGCFDAVVDSIKASVYEARENVRLPHCRGCLMPIKSLSDVILEVSKP